MFINLSKEEKDSKFQELICFAEKIKNNGLKKFV